MSASSSNSVGPWFKILECLQHHAFQFDSLRGPGPRFASKGTAIWRRTLWLQEPWQQPRSIGCTAQQSYGKGSSRPKPAIAHNWIQKQQPKTTQKQQSLTYQGTYQQTRGPSHTERIQKTPTLPKVDQHPLNTHLAASLSLSSGPDRPTRCCRCTEEGRSRGQLKKPWTESLSHWGLRAKGLCDTRAPKSQGLGVWGSRKPVPLHKASFCTAWPPKSPATCG